MLKTRPHLSFWQIWNMSFGFLGIQFGYALQNANTSRIFESLGANIDKIPILWIAAPVTGLIVQPIIGHLSDKTWTRLGRRKPFFLFGAILASLSLFLMPNSPSLWIAAGMLWIMDASINISMEPFRAFVGDMLPSDQRTKGFAMQSFFIGMGAVVGSVLPYILANWFHLSNEPLGNSMIPPTVKWSFYCGGFAFISAVLITILTTKEYSPQELIEFDTADRQNNPLFEGNKNAFVHREILPKIFSIFGFVFLVCGLVISVLVRILNLAAEIYILSVVMVLFAILFFMVALMRKNKMKNGAVEIMTDLLNMPKTMGQLAIVQFFTWLALFSLWIYMTPAVTEYHFHATDASSVPYNEGANWVGILFGAYSFFAALMAFLLPIVARKVSRKVTHLISLIIGGVGFISMMWFKDPNMLLISMFCVGIAWASILSMPYAMLTGSLPHAKMGVYMGIFNFFIVLPQILAATILGAITKTFFNNRPIYTIVFGGACLIVAGLLCLIVDDKDDPVQLSKIK